jgi:hypothetical protein
LESSVEFSNDFMTSANAKESFCFSQLELFQMNNSVKVNIVRQFSLSVMARELLQTKVIQTTLTSTTLMNLMALAT